MSKDNTLTFTARSAADPQRMATFTLHNGSVSVELVNALAEQVSEAYEGYRQDSADHSLATWLKPVATGSLQKLLQPIPLTDFDAELSGDGLQATAWLRAGGLRLAPVMMTWPEVDNPAGAQAFVDELQQRKEAIRAEAGAPAPLDYWASWILMGLAVVALPILFVRLWRKQRLS